MAMRGKRCQSAWPLCFFSDAAAVIYASGSVFRLPGGNSEIFWPICAHMELEADLLAGGERRLPSARKGSCSRLAAKPPCAVNGVSRFAGGVVTKLLAVVFIVIFCPSRNVSASPYYLQAYRGCGYGSVPN